VKQRMRETESEIGGEMGTEGERRERCSRRGRQNPREGERQRFDPPWLAVGSPVSGLEVRFPAVQGRNPVGWLWVDRRMISGSCVAIFGGFQ